MNKNPEQKLYQIAESQMGYFTTKQAISAGYLSNNHTYHIKQGHWIREYRSIYRLVNFPYLPEGEMVLWTLWSRNRNEVPEGVYSHETALSIYDISDAMPNKLHMTVPIGFRKSAQVPDVIVLYRAKLHKKDIREKSGYAVTTPFKTVLDLIYGETTPDDIVKQAVREFRSRGFLTEKDIVKLIETEPSLAKYVIEA